MERKRASLLGNGKLRSDIIVTFKYLKYHFMKERVDLFCVIQNRARTSEESFEDPDFDF